MLKPRLLHSEILEALARASHSSKFLIADGNYPFATRLGPNARLDLLNLSPVLVNTAQVLEAIVSAVPIEEATVMEPVTSAPYALEKEASVWSDFQRILQASGSSATLKKQERLAFFDAAKDHNFVLTIATDQQRLYANLLIEIGVVFPESNRMIRNGAVAQERFP
ncbi:MAG: RbsD/FucU family protein [Deltaproteobacteria bacterium]|nr:RbsD/FucU family protein [Deltaproteobacteria bacterium]